MMYSTVGFTPPCAAMGVPAPFTAPTEPEMAGGVFRFAIDGIEVELAEPGEAAAAAPPPRRAAFVRATSSTKAN